MTKLIKSFWIKGKSDPYENGLVHSIFYKFQSFKEKILKYLADKY